MNIYLDVDGVLLDRIGCAAPNLEEFLRQNVTGNTYWLTTRAKGDPTQLTVLFQPLVAPDIFELIKTIKPTTWHTSKTEAIDFTQPFIWYDDNPLVFELDDLKRHGVEPSLIRIGHNATGVPILPLRQTASASTPQL